TETFDGDLVRAMATGEAVAGAAEDLGTPVACGAVADVVALLRFREPALLRAGTFEAADVEAADLTRPAARITPLAEPARLTKPVPLLPVACVTLAAESAGAAAAALDMAVSYAKEREQFDRPIGSFQAIK